MTQAIGIVTADREAMIDLRVMGPHGVETNVEFCVDTGFSKYLTLPRSIVNSLQLPFRQASTGTLADGSSVVLDVYIADDYWLGQRRTVPIYAADATPLLGMSMLYGCDVRMSVVDGGNVVVEPIGP